MIVAIPSKSNEMISFPITGIVMAGNTGFASPADDYLDERIDLAKELVTNKANIFCWRVCGESFTKVHITHNAIVVFDYSLKAKAGNIVLVRLGDIMSLKIIKMIRGRPHLISASDGYPVIEVNLEDGVEVFGVLKHCIQSW